MGAGANPFERSPHALVIVEVVGGPRAVRSCSRSTTAAIPADAPRSDPSRVLDPLLPDLLARGVAVVTVVTVVTVPTVDVGAHQYRYFAPVWSTATTTGPVTGALCAACALALAVVAALALAVALADLAGRGPRRGRRTGGPRPAGRFQRVAGRSGSAWWRAMQGRGGPWCQMQS